MRVFGGYIKSQVNDKQWKSLWKKHSIQILDEDKEDKDLFDVNFWEGSVETSSLIESDISYSKSN